MVRSIVLALAILGPDWARADLRLQPEVTEFNMDGVRLKHLVFSDGSRQVTYSPPRGWEYTGSEDCLTLHSPAGTSGEAVIRKLKLAGPGTFDEVATARLCEQVVASLPSNATHATILYQEKNPLLIERKETFLVVINFNCAGVPYSRSVMFLNRGAEQMQFQLTSPSWSFPPLQKQFLASHFTWENL